MKLPLVAIVIGLLAGMGATILFQPETPAGTALILFVCILIATLADLIVARLRSKPGTPPAPPPSGPGHD